MAPIVRRTWAPVHHTPVLLQKTRSHKKISAIGAIGLKVSGRNPRLFFRLLKDQNIDTAACVQFLYQLKQNVRGRIIVVWDRLNPHRSIQLKNWLKAQARLCCEYFPPYAPELNPVEYLWSYLKTNPLANYAAPNLFDLYSVSKGSICKIRKEKNLLCSFIKHSPINFFD
jgi:transposase